ncbi:MAG: flagellar basal body-associated FliL family protein [Gammaproteobacteria bacterium]|nr:flagellar basal body-associated FliL family protein [Gammaproteobacteria bacterium]
MAGKDADLNLDLGGGKKKGKGKLFLIIGIVVALAGGGGAAFFLMKGKKADKGEPKEEAKAEHGEESAHAQATYVPLKDNFVVNIADDKRGRVAQIGVTLMSHSPDIAMAVEQNLPLIRSILLELFSAQKASELLTAEGKEKLRAEALKRLNGIFEEAKSETKIDKVLFTNMVMQ